MVSTYRIVLLVSIERPGSALVDGKAVRIVALRSGYRGNNVLASLVLLLLDCVARAVCVIHVFNRFNVDMVWVCDIFVLYTFF